MSFRYGRPQRIFPTLQPELSPLGLSDVCQKQAMDSSGSRFTSHQLCISGVSDFCCWMFLVVLPREAA